MIDFLNKKNFYSMILKDRFPLARIDFFSEKGEGNAELFRTPLGVVICVTIFGGGSLREVKMYDKTRGNFAIQNVFCGDNLIEIRDGVFVGVSSRLHIEEAIERDFLIKLDGVSIVARAHMLPKRESVVDKIPSLVYN